MSRVVLPGQASNRVVNLDGSPCDAPVCPPSDAEVTAEIAAALDADLPPLITAAIGDNVSIGKVLETGSLSISAGTLISSAVQLTTGIYDVAVDSGVFLAVVSINNRTSIDRGVVVWDRDSSGVIRVRTYDQTFTAADRRFSIFVMKG